MKCEHSTVTGKVTVIFLSYAQKVGVQYPRTPAVSYAYVGSTKHGIGTAIGKTVNLRRGYRY